MTNNQNEVDLPSSRVGLRKRFWAFHLRILHECYASDDYWNQTERAYRHLGQELRKRRRLQRVARYEKDSHVFWDKIKEEAEWFGPPLKEQDLSKYSKRAVRAWMGTIRRNPHILLHPELFLPERFADAVGGKAAFERFLTDLAQIRSGRPGEKPLPEHLMIEAQDLHDLEAGRDLRSPAQMAVRVFGIKYRKALPYQKTKYQEYVTNIRAGYNR